MSTHIVRLYDGFDNVWIDVTEPLSEDQAHQEWLRLTNNGTRKTKFEDIDYYKIFPSDSVMLYRSTSQI